MVNWMTLNLLMSVRSHVLAPLRRGFSFPALLGVDYFPPVFDGNPRHLHLHLFRVAHDFKFVPRFRRRPRRIFVGIAASPSFHAPHHKDPVRHRRLPDLVGADGPEPPVARQQPWVPRLPRSPRLALKLLE